MGCSSTCFCYLLFLMSITARTTLLGCTVFTIFNRYFLYKLCIANAFLTVKASSIWSNLENISGKPHCSLRSSTTISMKIRANWEHYPPIWLLLFWKAFFSLTEPPRNLLNRTNQFYPAKVIRQILQWRTVILTFVDQEFSENTDIGDLR